MSRGRVAAVLVRCLAVLACAAAAASCSTRQAAPVLPPPPDEPTPWEASGIDWSAPPPPAAERRYQPPVPREVTLGNGLRVVAVDGGRLPLVSAVLVVPSAGSVHDPAGQAGLASLTADLLDEGAGDWDALALARDLEGLGASIDIGAAPDYLQISLDTLASTLRPSLELLAAIVAEPRFLPADVERVLGDRLAAIDRRGDRPRAVAALVFDRILYGDHPYGYPSLGLRATVETLDGDDVRAFYDAHYAPAGATLVLVGGFELDDVLADLEATVGRWRSEARPPAAPPPPPPTEAEPVLALVDRPGAEQSVVYLGGLAMPMSDPRYFPATVIDTVVGGSFTSRLNQRLREELGWTYGAGSSFWLGRASGTWSVRTALDAPKTIEGIAEARAIVAAARTEPVPPAELARAKSQRIRMLPQELETNAAAGAQLARLAALELPVTWYSGYAEGIDAVTAEGAHEFAASMWTPERLSVVIVGDLEALRPRLDELGYDEIREFDVEGTPVEGD